MAIYKIFPYKDSTLYSLYPGTNTGLDAITELTNKLGTDSTPDVSRFLTQFDLTEMQDVIDNKIGNNSWDVSFRTFIANATGINTTSKVEIYPIAQDWDNGTGEYGDTPITTNGVCWGFSDTSGSTPWVANGTTGTEHFTSSFNPTYSEQGGGNWFYSGSGIADYSVTQSFDLRDSKDLNVGVKTIVSQWYSASIPNYGFITKWTSSIEFTPSSSTQPILKYFSVDTNTIYPPQLEFKWVDYTTVLTGSLTGSIVTESDIKLSFDNNPGVFYSGSINRFKINVSPTFPSRVYQTSSLYTTKYFLPTSSYYSIKDLDTNEIIINFDSNYTQISSDGDSNYFDIYMDGLEPERYYKILIKTTINGSIKIFDNDYYFKVVN